MLNANNYVKQKINCQQIIYRTNDTKYCYNNNLQANSENECVTLLEIHIDQLLRQSSHIGIIV